MGDEAPWQQEVGPGPTGACLMAILFGFLLMGSKILRMLKLEKPLEIAQVLISQMENQGPEKGSELPKVTQHMSQQFMSLYIHLVQAYRSTSWGKMPEVFWHRLDIDAAIWGAVL